MNNADTWCDQLATRDPRVEPVNLGQGGYGADQAYLRYLRDTKTLDHQVQLFAFIDDDFKRMQSSTFLGIDKPVLMLDNGYLTMLIGMVGTSIAPWMQFYLQAAVVEKGVTAKEYSCPC